MYDYNAADNDEISFVEGDIIIDGVSIDEGWMEGTNQRTGEFGMLPANYVEEIWSLDINLQPFIFNSTIL